MSGRSVDGQDGLAPVTELFSARRGRDAAVEGSERPGVGGVDDVAAPPLGGWLPPVTGGPVRPAPLHAVSSQRDAEQESAGAGAESDDRAAVVAAGEAPSRTREDEFADAERISMRTLARRGVSAAELRTVLSKQELGADVVEHEIARLTGVGLVNDAELAAVLSERLRERKGLGRQAVVHELRRRGIDQDDIDAALTDQTDDDASGEVARATALAVKRAPQMRGLDRTTAERRLSGFLMRKGYGGSVVRSAVQYALDAQSGGRGGVRFE